VRTHNFVVSCDYVTWHFLLGAREVKTLFDIKEKNNDYAINITTAQNLVSWICASIALYFHKFYIVLHQDMQFRFFPDLPKWQSFKCGLTEALQPVLYGQPGHSLPFPHAFVIPFLFEIVILPHSWSSHVICSHTT
jgi:hypothetical protein